MNEMWWKSWGESGQDDVLSEEQKENLELQKRERDRRLVAAVHDLAATEHGTEFLRWVMAQCGVFEELCADNAKRAAFLAGRRAFGLSVFALCVRDGCATAVVDDLREVEIE